MKRWRWMLPAAAVILCLQGCVRHPIAKPAPSSEPGRARFETYCAGCHLNEGPFMRGEGPPLEGSSWIKGPESVVIRIVLHGLRGPIEVAGAKYNQEMPGFGPILTDSDIASLVSYVRTRFGNAPPVGQESVSRIRAAHPGRTDQWTVDELLKQQ